MRTRRRVLRGLGVVVSIGLVGALLPATALAGNWPGVTGNLGWDTRGLTAEVSGDSVSNAQSLTFGWGWGSGLQTGVPGGITNPTISVRTGYPPATFGCLPGCTPTGSGFTSTQASLASGAEMFFGLPSTLTSRGTTGFDAIRAVTPLSVPAGGGTQVISVTVILVRPLSNVLAVSFDHDVLGETISCGTTTAPTAPTSGPNAARCTADPARVTWMTCVGPYSPGNSCLPVGQAAVFTAIVNVPNASTHRLMHMPQVQVKDNLLQQSYTVAGPVPESLPLQCAGPGGPGVIVVPRTTSITVPDPTLDGPVAGVGSVTFSSTESVCWLGTVNDAYTVHFAPRLLAVSVSDAIAPGVNRGTGGFRTSSLVLSNPGYVTYLVRFDPSFAGQKVEIWVRSRNGTWAPVTLRLVAADGTVHYYRRIMAWTGFWAKLAGASSHGRIGTVR